MNGCMSVIGFFFGHKLVPIFDEVKSAAPESFDVDIGPRRGPVDINLSGILETMRNVKRTYRGSVCRRCGHKVLP